MTTQPAIDEQSPLYLLSNLKSKDILNRVSAVIKTNRTGATSLVAMTIPEQRLDAIASIICSYLHTIIKMYFLP